LEIANAESIPLSAGFGAALAPLAARRTFLT